VEIIISNSFQINGAYNESTITDNFESMNVCKKKIDVMVTSQTFRADLGRRNKKR